MSNSELQVIRDKGTNAEIFKLSERFPDFFEKSGFCSCIYNYTVFKTIYTLESKDQWHDRGENMPKIIILAQSWPSTSESSFLFSHCIMSLLCTQ